MPIYAGYLHDMCQLRMYVPCAIARIMWYMSYIRAARKLSSTSHRPMPQHSWQERWSTFYLFGEVCSFFSKSMMSHMLDTLGKSSRIRGLPPVNLCMGKYTDRIRKTGLVCYINLNRWICRHLMFVNIIWAVHISIRAHRSTINLYNNVSQHTTRVW